MENTVQPPTMPQQVESDHSMLLASDDSAAMKQIQATHAPDGRDKVDVKMKNTASTAQPPTMPQVVEISDHQMLSASDESTVMKQIQATHDPDGCEVDGKPILHIIENILHRASTSRTDSAGTLAPMDTLEDKTNLPAFDEMLDAMAHPIQRISSEITKSFRTSRDSHETAVALFTCLSSYTWDAKVVLTLAAFAVNYAEYLVIAELYSTNSLTKSIALLEHLMEIKEPSNLNSQFDALYDLIKDVFDVTKSIVEFKKLLSQDFLDTFTVSIGEAHIPTAAYWTIRSIVACASQITSLTSITATTEARELSSLTHEVSNIHSNLKQQFALCYQHIDEKRQLQAFHTLVHLFEVLQEDNMKILKELIYYKDDMQPLVDGSTKERVNIEVLRSKIVLLLISNLDISHDELTFLNNIYQKSRMSPEIQYEVVWLPIMEKSTPWNEVNQQKFEQLQSRMPWYTIHHPLLLVPEVIRYIKEVWHFANIPIVVPLDLYGSVACPNALHMMRLWGNSASPFTMMIEEALWEKEVWGLELLVDNIDAAIMHWIKERKFICLYGGGDRVWIRKFTTTAKAVATAAGITLEMVYVGNAKGRELRENIETIRVENLSLFWSNPAAIWFFWTRLESMLFSKIQQGKTVENDRIMQEVMEILSFDASDQEWALISKGSEEIVKGRGDKVLTSMLQFEKWQENAKKNGFVKALNDYLNQLHTPHRCNRLIVPHNMGSKLTGMICADCSRPLRKYFIYRCCDD